MGDVVVTGIAAGGDGVGHLDDGRAVFVRGAIPGDTVRVEVTEERPRFARAVAAEVLTPAPGRVAPPCPHVAEGCGGCGWQHVAPAEQRVLKARIVVDALTRIGRLPVDALPDVDPGPVLADLGYRTTVRAAFDPDGGDGAGLAGLRTHHGHDVVAFGDAGCPVAHPLVDEVLRVGRFPGATEVTVRAGVATGERLALVDPGAGAVEGVPGDVVVIGADELRAGRRAWLHEDIAGRRYRISAGSFFQTRPDGAAALVDAVAAAVGPSPGHLVDLYGGVGLFAAALADRLGARPTVVEANRSAVADARVNLEGAAGARVVRADVRRWRPSSFDAVVADPSRHGLGAGVVDRIAATGAERLALVSCDPGALGRDAGLLVAAGYRLATITLVDLFPHTPHVEVVTAWHRSGAPTTQSG
jgi:23S rRNA (uracil1939-C5)-methyltransferase